MCYSTVITLALTRMPAKTSTRRSRSGRRAGTWKETSWSRSRSEGDRRSTSRCSSLEQMGLRSPSGYRSHSDFIDITGFNYDQFKTNAASSEAFPQSEDIGFAISMLQPIDHIDSNGQPTCVAIITNLLTAVSQLADPLDVRIKHEPVVPRSQSARFGDILLYIPASPVIQPFALIELKVRYVVDTPPAQLMVGTKALFSHYQITTNIICCVVFGGYMVDIFETDQELTVHYYN